MLSVLFYLLLCSCHFAGSSYAECRWLSAVLLNVAVMSVVILNVVVMSVVMIYAIMLSVIILSVLAPHKIKTHEALKVNLTN